MNIVVDGLNHFFNTMQLEVKMNGGVRMLIAEVSKKYEISADTLRYYERIGLIPPVPRNQSGIRDYDEESCGWIELMKCMRKSGVQIEALIEYVTLFQKGDETIDTRKALLIEQRNRLTERMEDIQTSLNRLNEKIKRYEQGLMTVEKRLQRMRDNKDN